MASRRALSFLRPNQLSQNDIVKGFPHLLGRATFMAGKPFVAMLSAWRLNPFFRDNRRRTGFIIPPSLCAVGEGAN